jgi:hypothetical protein
MVTCPQAVIEAALSVCHAVMMPVGGIRLLFRAPKGFPDGQKSHIVILRSLAS